VKNTVENGEGVSDKDATGHSDVFYAFQTVLLVLALSRLEKLK
jgi:hypothetical protein